MANDGKIRDKKLQHIINRKAAKNQYYHQKKFININILQAKKYYIMISVK